MASTDVRTIEVFTTMSLRDGEVIIDAIHRGGTHWTLLVGPREAAELFLGAKGSNPAMVALKLNDEMSAKIAKALEKDTMVAKFEFSTDDGMGI